MAGNLRTLKVPGLVKDMNRVMPTGAVRLQLGCLLAAVFVLLCAQAQNRSSAAPQAKGAQQNSYVDPALCSGCHQGIAVTFAKTGMARSFYRATPQNLADAVRNSKPFFHEASHSYFETFERDGKFYQRRWQLGFDGRDTNVEEKQIDYVLGSGKHAQTFLHWTARNTLQQLPLGWYAEKGGSLGMNPGYDRLDYQGSTRAIHYECMFCHNAYPRIPAPQREAGAEARYSGPLPEGIDCQRCHGPGARHVALAAAAGATPEQIRAAIVNPARLSPDGEIEVCLQCHLETTSRLLPHSITRLNRGPFDYVPGQPLENFRLDLDRAPGRNEDFEVAHAAYRLRASQCFLKSAGKLRCTSCHNPHDIPRGEAAERHYNSVCQGCHAAPQAAGHQPQADCVGCHMPKRRTDDAVHIAMTDHKILRQKPAGDLLAEKPEKHETPANSYRGPVVPFYPERPARTPEIEMYLALAQIKERSNLQAGLLQLSALIEKHRPAQAGFYSGLGGGYRAAGDLAKAISCFEKAARRSPTVEIVWLQLGNALMESGQWTKAESALRRARSLRPDDAAASGMLGWSLWQQNRAAEAKAALEAAVKLDPDLPDTRNYLGSLLMATGDAKSAEREFREAVRINPAVAEYRAKLAALLASRGALPEAAWDAKAAVEADPDLASARLLLGQLLLAGGDAQGGIRELETAIRLKPDSGRAHYELGVALARSGNRVGAIEHLRIAAQGPDQDARTAAAQVLRTLGQ
jgi:predicted CXXCH cytochrome family protein